MNNACVTVARREIMVKLTDKSFIISTVTTVLLMVVAFFGVNWFQNRATTTDVVVTEPQAVAIVQAADQMVRADKENSAVVLHEAPSEDRAKEMVLAGDADAWLHQVDGRWELTWKSESKMSFEATVSQVLQSMTIADLAAQTGTTPAELGDRMTLSSTTLEGDSSPMVSYFVGLAFALLFMMSSLVYGMQIATSVIEEKQSRIVEILVSIIPVRSLLAGKVIGQTVMAVGQLVLLLGIGLIGLSTTKYTTMLPNLSQAVAWFVVFFLAGFLALACIWAGAGALGTRSEDVQHTAAPVTYLLMAAYFAGFLATGTAKEILSFVPVVSAVLMPTRVIDNTVSWWEPVVALVLNLVFAVIMVMIGERIYRRALLQTGGRMSYRAALTMKE